MSLSRLLQLASPMLPIGAYSYSQGLEWAIESGQVHDAATAQQWVEDALHIAIIEFDLPVLKRLYMAWSVMDDHAIQQWDAYYRASRDSAEFYAESSQMANALLRLQRDLAEWPAEILQRCHALKTPSFPTLYAASAWQWQISVEQMLHAYAWSWLENQASAAMKTIPLGQVAGQRLISTLAQPLADRVQQAMMMEDAEIHNFCPGLSIASCRHETQYSRLFRS